MPCRGGGGGGGEREGGVRLGGVVLQDVLSVVCVRQGMLRIFQEGSGGAAVPASKVFVPIGLPKPLSADFVSGPSIRLSCNPTDSLELHRPRQRRRSWPKPDQVPSDTLLSRQPFMMSCASASECSLSLVA